MSDSTTNMHPEDESRAGLDSLSRPALLLDPRDYTIDRSNDAFSTVTGFSDEDIVGRSLSDFFSPDADAPELFKQTARWVPGFLKLKGGASLRCQKQSRETPGAEAVPVVVFDPLDSTPSSTFEPDEEFSRNHTGTKTGTSNNNDPTPIRESFRELSDTGDDVALIRVEIEEFQKLIGCLSSDSINALLEAVIESLPEQNGRLHQHRIDYEAILLFSIDSPGRVQELAEDVIRSIEQPKQIDSQTYYLHANLGIAVHPENGSTSEELMQHAKFSQRQAAGDRGSSYRFYESSQAQEAREEVELRNDLYGALDEDQFQLYYQPLVSLEDGSIEGAEALIRWEHPRRGLLSPGAFIESAEATGQILFLDQWVLKTAVGQAARWHDSLEKPLNTNVNISALQFQDNYLIDKLESTLEESDLPADRFRVEITERSVMEDTDYTARVMESLKEIGVEIALDDFGTGHATFENLTRFPIDVLKIDRGFLNFDDVYNKNQKLLEIMIETGHRIGVDIVAEGVETKQQLNFLRNKGCQYAQGFYFARPVPSSQFNDLLRKNPSFSLNGR